MRRSLQRRLDALAKKVYGAQRRMQLVWKDTTDTDVELKAKIRAMIASGQARPNDRFCTIGWSDTAGEGADH